MEKVGGRRWIRRDKDLLCKGFDFGECHRTGQEMRMGKMNESYDQYRVHSLIHPYRDTRSTKQMIKQFFIQKGTLSLM